MKFRQGERREFSLAVQRAALDRAHWRCEQCSIKHSLQFHHVGHRGDRSLFNCKVLCVACHGEIHRNEMLKVS